MSEASSSQPVAFEAALAHLQRIVADLEEGHLGLEESLAQFEQGVGLLRTCHQILDQAELKISQLVKLEADGSEVVQPFDATATFGSETAAETGKKAGRRKAEKKAPSAPPSAPDTAGPETEENETNVPRLF